MISSLNFHSFPLGSKNFEAKYPSFSAAFPPEYGSTVPRLLLSMPSSSLSPIYTNFINFLHPSLPLPQILELDILPSSYPSTLYSSPPSLALPKPLLASLFVTAHAEFFAYITSRKGVFPDGGVQGRPGDGGSPADESSGGSNYNAALSATRVLLLWDPNHTTAANFRKRHLLSRSQSTTPFIPNSQSTTSAPAPPAATFLSLLRAELSFLTSLVTSPLPKAPKASTLWAHRLWLLRSFRADVLVLFQQEQVKEEREPEVDSPSAWTEEGANTNPEDTAAEAGNKAPQIGEPTPSSLNSALQNLYTTELHIVMRAADRHPRNFYAWGYARALFTHLTNPPPPTNHPIPTSPILPFPLALSVLPLTHSWCMTHPRDISGWTFLVFLMQRLGPLGSPPAGTGPEPVGEVLTGNFDMQRAARREVDRILSATTVAAERFQWRGESVRLFLGSGGGVWEGRWGK